MNPCFNVAVPSKLQPKREVLEAIYPLYWKDTFLGSCVAISPKILVSAGHHFNMMKDDVGDFTVLARKSYWIPAEYALKVKSHDLLVLWIGEAVAASVNLRGFLPLPQSRVSTIWLSPKPPHEPIFSPGVIISSDENNCVVQGTVSTTGSSGAPVVDIYGDHVIGIHLSSNMKDGSRVSDFLPARKIISLLAETNVSCR